MKNTKAVVAIMMGLWLTIPSHTLAQPQADAYAYQPFQDKQTMQTVNRIYQQMSWEERIAQLYGVTPGRLTDKSGKLSPRNTEKICSLSYISDSGLPIHVRPFKPTSMGKLKLPFEYRPHDEPKMHGQRLYAPVMS